MLRSGQHAMRDTNLLKGKQQNTTKRTVCTVYYPAKGSWL